MKPPAGSCSSNMPTRNQITIMATLAPMPLLKMSNPVRIQIQPCPMVWRLGSRRRALSLFIIDLVENSSRKPCHQGTLTVTMMVPV
ncbi:hypothetical protein D3C84_709530 [compost metagenome]